MASLVEEAADISIPSDILSTLVLHVFLPLRLPQKADEAEHESVVGLWLCQLMALYAHEYRQLVPATERNIWNHIAKMLEHLTHTAEAPLQKDQLAKDLKDLTHGDILALNIREQNAAIVIRIHRERSVFEIFEVVPPTEEVMAGVGNLVRQYPGPAVEVPSRVWKDSKFIDELASFLVHMDSEPLQGATATTRKAGSKVTEVRDSVHPRYISQLLTGILRGLGGDAQVTRIQKRIADDVLWKDAFKPWRRSGLWLIIRVALQTSLSRLAYKSFMLFSQAKLISLGVDHELSSDLLFHMRAKTARRIYKLRAMAVPDFVSDFVEASSWQTENLLQKRWVDEQQRQAHSARWAPQELNYIQDTQITLRNSTAYLRNVLKQNHKRSESQSYSANEITRLSGRNFHAFGQGLFASAIKDDGYVALADFEQIVQKEFDKWVKTIPNEASACLTACETIASCINQYEKASNKFYTVDPVDKSIAILTILKLWTGLDQLAVQHCPLLREYSPEIPRSFLEPLLLHSQESISCSIDVERYIHQRHENIVVNTSLLSGTISSQCFAARYFLASSSLQRLMASIRETATQERAAKIAELEAMNNKHQSLMEEAYQLEHESFWNRYSRRSQHNFKGRCTRCRLQKQANNMSIAVHEWHLPRNELQARMVVFELACPPVIEIWRSMTYKLLVDIGREDRPKPAPPPVHQSLEHYLGLDGMGAYHPLRRITLASKKKSFIQSHYARSPLPANESRVCVNNGLEFQLFDTATTSWVAGPFDDSNVKARSTLLLPKQSPYHYLQYAVDGTEHTTNQVIADESECPSELTLHEHIAFGSLRSGPLLQWMNILRELHSNSLTFSREEVFTLIAQAAWQAGPLSNSQRAWHEILNDPSFSQLLVNASLHCLERIEANWQECVTVKILVLIAVRVLGSSKRQEVRRSALDFLKKARITTYRWLHQLVKLLQSGEESLVPEYQLRVCEMAAICRATYDIEPLDIDRTISGDTVSILIECAVILNENLPASITHTPPHIQLLLRRDQRLAHKLEGHLRKSVVVDRAGFDIAMHSVWHGYRKALSSMDASPTSRWIMTFTAGSSSQVSQKVQYNLIEGKLLVDGRPVGRLPRELVTHPTYLRLFGQRIFDVIPADQPGMDYAARQHYHGYKVSFALNQHTQELHIHALKGSTHLQLVPHTRLSGDFPIFLVDEHVHWLDLQSCEIEFRPLKECWASSPDNWRLSLSKTVSPAHMSQSINGTERRLLIDLNSSTFRMIASRLSSLEQQCYLTMVYNTETLCISIDLPRFRLQFEIINGQLESLNLRGMIVDDVQSTGTMIGLRSQLVLRSKDTQAQALPQSRSVLIPHAPINISSSTHHVQVEVDTASLRYVQYHEYKIDKDLGYLSASTDLTGRLYKIYLHALTSHCLPDILTRRTGVEEALHELSLGAVYSFQRLMPEDVNLLVLIGSLTPGHFFYPPDLRRMHSVFWSTSSPFAEHYAFSSAASSILEYARSLQIFQADRALDLDESIQKLARNPFLLARHAHRGARYCPGNLKSETILSGKDTEAVDHVYHPSRDFADSSINLNGLEEVVTSTQLVTWASHATWSTSGSWSFHLRDRTITQWHSVPGVGEGPSSKLELGYQSEWLSLDLESSWISMYEIFRRAQNKDQYRLLFSLSAMVYGQPSLYDFIPLLIAVSKTSHFRLLVPPSWTSYNLADGFAPLESTTADIVSSHVYTLEQSPAAEMSREDEEEEEEFYERQSKNYDDEKESLTQSFAEALIKAYKAGHSLRYPSYRHVLWFDTSACIEEVGEYFASCRHNSELLDHIISVENTMTTRIPMRPVIIMADPLSIPFYYTQPDDRNSLPSEITLGDLLRLPVTRLPPFLEKVSLKITLSTADEEESLLPDVDELTRLVSELRASRRDGVRRRYGTDLERSLHELLRTEGESSPHEIPPTAILDEYREKNRDYYSEKLRNIEKMLSPQTDNRPEQILAVSGLWPRVSLRVLIEQLSLRYRGQLSSEWNTLILNLAQAFSNYQQAQRLHLLSRDGKVRDFDQEIRSSLGEREENPDQLLLEIDGDFRVRPLQMKVAQEMILPSSRTNTVLQLNMGEGKSSVIVPMISAILANGKTLTRIVVLKALSAQMFHLLVNRLGGLVNRRVFYLPFSRSITINAQTLRIIEDIYRQCMREGGVLVAQPEHILSFKLMGVEKLSVSELPGDSDVALDLKIMQEWISTNSRDILDESDEILHVRYQLVYTLGQQQPLEDHPDRWTTIQHLFSLLHKHAPSVKKTFPNEVEYYDFGPGQFPTIRILETLSSNVSIHLKRLISTDVLEGALPNINITYLGPSGRDLALRFLTNAEMNQQDMDRVKRLCAGAWLGLLLLRGLLALDILPHVLREKRYRVNYGLDLQRCLLAVPFIAKDIPSPRAEFGHPDVAVSLTCLSYYYTGLNVEQLQLCFESLSRLDNPALEYQIWVSRHGSVPISLCQFSGVNTKDVQQFHQEVVPIFSRNHATIDFYLSHIIFPKAAKQFPFKLAASGWDLAEPKKNVTTGFSGTNDNHYLLPTSIVQEDPVRQLSTNALVLTYLLRPENNHYGRLTTLDDDPAPVEHFLKTLVRQQPRINVLLDVGAQMLELKNRELVELWLRLKPKGISAAVFFNERDELEVLSLDGSIEPFSSSPFRQQLDRCVVYLDDAHTRGTDLKLPQDARAAVTLGPKVTKDRLLQGCMRMRQLGHGQSVMFFAPPEVHMRIRPTQQTSVEPSVRVIDILRWAMGETCVDIHHHIPHWAYQGLEYARRAEAYRQFSNDMNSNIELLLSKWRTPESRSLEQMYGSQRESVSLTKRAYENPLFRERLEFLSISLLNDPSMEEEQEREVSHEAERERQLERPEKKKPAKHHIHADLFSFVTTGVLDAGSPAFENPLGTLRGLDSSLWTLQLLATKDFLRTIKGHKLSQLSPHLRPVHWILSSNRQRENSYIIVSPYEANSILPFVQASRHVHLHMFNARVTQSMKSFSNLDFYATPGLPPTNWKPPNEAIQSQLNLWSGTLYLDDYDSYISLCAFLGVFSEESKNLYQMQGFVQRQGDGFIEPIHRGLKHGHLRVLDNYGGRSFQESPIAALKNLFGLRRHGMAFLQTHMGQLLHGRPLTRNDFEHQ